MTYYLIDEIIYEEEIICQDVEVNHKEHVYLQLNGQFCY